MFIESRTIPVGITGDRYHAPMDFGGDNAGNVRMRPWDRCVMAVDPSVRGKDETGYAVLKVLNSQLFLVDSGQIPGGYEDAALEMITRVASKHQVHAGAGVELR